MGFDYTHSAHVAVGTALLAGGIASSASAFQHFMNENVEIKSGLLLSIGAVIASFIIPPLVFKLPKETLERLLIAVFSFSAVKLLIDKENGEDRKIIINNYYLVLFGFAVGTVSSVTGLGGGILYIPILVFFFGKDIRKAIGTSAFTVSISMLTAAFSYANTDIYFKIDEYQFGYVYLPAALILGISSMAGTLLGVSYTFKLPRQIIKKIFAVLLLIVLLKIIFTP